MDLNQSPQETSYEIRQKHNKLVSWLHTLRWKNILEVFTRFAANHSGETIEVADIGCGSAKLFSILNPGFKINYSGIEIKPEYIEAARQRYDHFPNFRLIPRPADEAITSLEKADLVVALEFFEHIPETEVISILKKLQGMPHKNLVFSVPVEIGPALLMKNLGSFLTGYMRHKEYSWKETLLATFYQLHRLPPRDLRHKGFDWRKLIKLIKRTHKIVEFRKYPLSFLPAAFAFNVFFVAEPRETNRIVHKG